jgi:hypothetical protein
MQLDEHLATENDVVSVILMRDTSEVVVHCEPLDWVLYNKLIDMRDWTECRPSGAGNYLPALEVAESLLAVNHKVKALALMFFSDGKPSDNGPFVEKMGEIASKYRRRLNFCCIGMADDNEDFKTLNDMVTEAGDYGAISSFNRPSLDTESLSNIISSMSSTLTATKTEMTDVATGRTRVIRHDVRSERKGAADDLQLTSEWRVYDGKSWINFVIRIWSWNSRTDDFVCLRDPRCIFCYADCINQVDPPGRWCPHCEAAAICEKCSDRLDTHYKSHNCYFRKKFFRAGKLISDVVIPSFSVAMKEPIFGEGAERIVRKFRYLDRARRFVGPKMVAKESRFIDEHDGTYRMERAFHANFLRTQALASDYAGMFNNELDQLCARHDWIREIPRIHFVQPLVVEVVDAEGKVLNILIERFLQGEYEKFNNNMGYIKGRTRREENEVPINDIIQTLNELRRDDLRVIEEEEEVCVCVFLVW